MEITENTQLVKCDHTKQQEVSQRWFVQPCEHTLFVVCEQCLKDIAFIACNACGTQMAIEERR